MPVLQGKARDGDADGLVCLEYFPMGLRRFFYMTFPCAALTVLRLHKYQAKSDCETQLQHSYDLATRRAGCCTRPETSSIQRAALSKLEMLPLLLAATLFNGAAAFYLPGASRPLGSVKYQLMLSYRSRAEGLQEERGHCTRCERATARTQLRRR
jgi:hypothetical protein